jgi:limonene-1,2-epoxide hydrolase
MDPETLELGATASEKLTNTEIAETYLEAIRSKDPRKARLAPNVTLQFPLTASKVVGRDSVIDYLVSLLPGIDDVKLERHMTGGDYVTTLWESRTVWGVIPVCSVFRIAEGQIQEVRSFWDPRPVLAKP